MGAAEDDGAGLGLSRETADGLGKTTFDNAGADNLGEATASVAEMADTHSPCMGVPATDPTTAGCETTAEEPTVTGEARPGAPSNRGRADTTVGADACKAGNLGKADTTFVLLANSVEFKPVAPVNWTGVTLGLAATNGGPRAGVHATKGELMAGTLGSLFGDWGKTDA